MGQLTPLFSRKQPGGAFTVQDTNDTTGNHWYACSVTTGASDAAGYGYNPSAPTATIDYAIGLATASNGDTIHVMPGHVEAVISDGLLAVDKAGITIRGMGEGDARPLITISTDAAACAIISGAGCVIDNMRFSIAIDAATDPIQISGAGCVMKNCEIIEAASCEALDLISVTGARVKLHDLIIRGRNTTDGDALNAIHLDGCDDVEIYNIHAYNGDWKEGVIFNQGDECLDVHIHDCILQTKATEDLSIVLDTNATGEIHDIKCILFENAANIDECIVPGKCHVYDPVLVVNNDGEKAVEWAGTDSTDA